MQHATATEHPRHHVRWKWVWRFQPGYGTGPLRGLLRVVRVMWERGEAGRGGWSTKLSLGLEPALFSRGKETYGWLVTVLGVRLHYQRSYGGRHG